MGRHYVKLTLPFRKAATLLRERELFYGLPTVGLEWDFIQARAGSQDIVSLEWTDREFSCLDAILDHKREGHQGEPCLGD